MISNNRSAFLPIEAREIWLCLLTLFLLPALSGCERKSKSSMTPGVQKKVMDIQEGEIIDTAGNEGLFEERKALWLKNTPQRYRLGFSFNCDCTQRTAQFKVVKKAGKTFIDRSGDLLTIEVKDGKVIEIRKEDGEQILLKEFRAERFPSDLVEYIWNPGKSESDGNKLLSEPVEFLWKRAQEAIQSKPQKKITITYDKQYWFIKKIDFTSSIPDYYFQGEIKDFIPLN